jgi:hypothetical protein
MSTRGERGHGRIYQRGRVWWIAYSHRGRKFRESSGSTRRSDAVELLRQRLDEMGTGRLVGLDAERVTVANLLELVRADYRMKDRRSGARMERAPGSLSPSLARTRRGGSPV